MDITVYGSGYVGLVVAACFAQMGNQVVCMDIDVDKVKKLNQGEVPIYEPGLAEILTQFKQNLTFTTDPVFAAKHGLVQFIAVGTPPDPEGKVDLQYVKAAAQMIAENIEKYTIIVNKSTVPIGAATLVHGWIQDKLDALNKTIEFDVVSNPEFLREGCALGDFRHPDRIIIGAPNDKSEQVMQSLYSPFDPNHDKTLFMSVRSAELTKYAANAFLATKISFINQIANLAEKVHADIEEVRIGLGSDHRIGHAFLNAGCGYGGSCFGKDCDALLHVAEENNVSLELIQSAQNVNNRQKLVIFDKLKQVFGESLQGKTFAIWGLSFKPGTDDMRDAPSIPLLKALHQAGAKTQMFDPKAMQKSKQIFPPSGNCIYSDDKMQALEGADALIALTEWPEFKQCGLAKIKKSLKRPIIFDGRNIFSLESVKEYEMQYYGMGRVVQTPNVFE